MQLVATLTHSLSFVIHLFGRRQGRRVHVFRNHPLNFSKINALKDVTVQRKGKVWRLLADVLTVFEERWTIVALSAKPMGYQGLVTMRLSGIAAGLASAAFALVLIEQSSLPSAIAAPRVVDSSKSGDDSKARGIAITPAQGGQALPAVDSEDFIEGNYWALIIGIDKYPALEKDKQLTVARKDAERLATLLVDRYGFSRQNMVELYDEKASLKAMIHAFTQLKRRLSAKDSLFIYYAGNGEYEGSGGDRAKADKMGYWVPYDGERDDPASYLFNSQVRDYLGSIPARHIYVVVDSYFSGSLMARTRALTLGRGAIKELYSEKSRWVLASGGLHPVADPADQSKQGHSVFAWHFMKILEENANPYLLAKDIVGPLTARVSNEPPGLLPRSAPVLAVGDEGGQFVFRLRKEHQKAAAPDSAALARLEAERAKVAAAQQELRELEEKAKQAEQAVQRSQPDKLATTPAAVPSPAAPVKPAETASVQGKDKQKKVAEKPKPIEEARVRPFETPQQAGREITAKDGVPMALVPAGEFTMGSSEDKPAHRVHLDAFYIDQHELTTARYGRFLKATGRKQPDHWNEVNMAAHGDRPVIGVDWQDADAYCRWVGKRLPTEAEWEKAARGSDGRQYPWGNERPTSLTANFGKCCDWKGYASLAPVGSLEAGKSPYGVSDMAGNVYEWVADWYGQRYYQNSPYRNPKGPSSGEYKVLRGGSWHSPSQQDVRATVRLWDVPTAQTGAIGFRCVQDLPK